MYIEEWIFLKGGWHLIRLLHICLVDTCQGISAAFYVENALNNLEEGYVQY